MTTQKNKDCNNHAVNDNGDEENDKGDFGKL